MTLSKKVWLAAGSTLAALTLSAAVIASPGDGMGFGSHHSDGYGSNSYGHKGSGHHRMQDDDDQERMEKRLSKMQRYLDLNDTQVTELKALFEQHRQQMPEQPRRRALRSGLGGLDPMAADYDTQVDQLIKQQQLQMAEHIRTQANFRKSLYQLLEPEQREKLEQMQERRQSKRDKD